eukprot:CAMPEP_0194342846 /NCGR_PEP_ID=MMETSP0171-20130528/94178_1 /TAXON_ID=218684 /ORGANISM="Corethron pennatum, Strain L29A3" /LENGTH=439 /DNA_ID=CAMNT_0039108763 /DNA_START=260 /DNA_END=1580 /DNA_ORIENTATION=-
MAGLDGSSSIGLISTGIAPEFIRNRNETLLPVDRLVHKAFWGMGHRLLRTATIWHMAKALNITQVKFQWRTCTNDLSHWSEDEKSGPTIFSYLFGDDVFAVTVPRPFGSSLPPQPRRGLDIMVRNDVRGYIGGQTFKNHRLPLLSKVYRHENSPFLEKMASDAEFYRLLWDRFVHKEEVTEFERRNRFEEHFVVGVHLRLGNGELTHFNESGRGVHNEIEFVANITDLLHHFIGKVQADYPRRFDENKTPLIFLATDTPRLVPDIMKSTESFGVPTIVLPQIRAKDNEGVTYEALRGKGGDCLDGWRAMFSDAFLLARSDVVVAARVSTFTQSLPLSAVLEKSETALGPRFCEVSDTATSMTCMEDAAAWLFRDSGRGMITYSTEGGPVEPVVHNVAVLLPDVELAEEFSVLINHLNERSFIHQQKKEETFTYTYGNSE